MDIKLIRELDEALHAIDLTTEEPKEWAANRVCMDWITRYQEIISSEKTDQFVIEVVSNLTDNDHINSFWSSYFFNEDPAHKEGVMALPVEQCINFLKLLRHKLKEDYVLDLIESYLAQKKDITETEIDTLFEYLECSDCGLLPKYRPRFESAIIANESFEIEFPDLLEQMNAYEEKNIPMQDIIRMFEAWANKDNNSLSMRNLLEVAEMLSPEMLGAIAIAYSNTFEFIDEEIYFTELFYLLTDEDRKTFMDLWLASRPDELLKDDKLSENMVFLKPEQSRLHLKVKGIILPSMGEISKYLIAHVSIPTLTPEAIEQYTVDRTNLPPHLNEQDIEVLNAQLRNILRASTETEEDQCVFLEEVEACLERLLLGNVQTEDEDVRIAIDENAIEAIIHSRDVFAQLLASPEGLQKFCVVYHTVTHGCVANIGTQLQAITMKALIEDPIAAVLYQVFMDDIAYPLLQTDFVDVLGGGANAPDTNILTNKWIHLHDLSPLGLFKKVKDSMSEEQVNTILRQTMSNLDYQAFVAMHNTSSEGIDHCKRMAAFKSLQVASRLLVDSPILNEVADALSNAWTASLQEKPYKDFKRVATALAKAIGEDVEHNLAIAFYDFFEENKQKLFDYFALPEEAEDFTFTLRASPNCMEFIRLIKDRNKIDGDFYDCTVEILNTISISKAENIACYVPGSYREHLEMQ